MGLTMKCFQIKTANQTTTLTHYWLIMKILHKAYHQQILIYNKTQPNLLTTILPKKNNKAIEKTNVHVEKMKKAGKDLINR